PFEDDTFKKAMSLGIYEHPVNVKKRKDGRWETVKGSSKVIFANERMKERFIEKTEAAGSKNMIFELTEDEFCAIRFPDPEAANASEIIFKELKELENSQMEKRFLQKLEQEQREKQRMENGVQKQGERDMKGSISDLVERYADQLTDAQLEEIVLGIKNGLQEDDVKSYFFLPAENMRQIRISL